MRRIATAFLVGLVATACGCTHVETRANQCGGCAMPPKAACDPVDVLSTRPNRPFQPIGVVQVRVDRGTGLTHPKMEDAIPELQNVARAIGADAVILTHEEFLSWYDNGEDKSPIHDLEEQESWYITEKGRYLSGLAVHYTGPCAPPPPPPQPFPCAPYPTITPGPQQGPVPTPGTAPPPDAGAPPAAPPPAPPPSPPPSTEPPPPPLTPPTQPPPAPTGPLPPPRRLS
jgi:hypothetical protein